MNSWKKFTNHSKNIKMVDPSYTLKVVPKDINNLTVELELYKDGNWVASVRMKFNYGDNTTAWIDSGRTAETYKRQGYGTWLRALCVHIAKKAGIEHIHQLSKNVNHLSRNRPPSAYIMNKLGFTRLPFRDPRIEWRVLNTKNVNMSRFFKNIKFTGHADV
jgi:hypothetical protein